MTDHLTAALEYASQHQADFLASLKDFLRIPSVSARDDAEGKAEVRRGARWAADYLQNIGMEHVQVFDTPMHPIVYADWLHAGPDKPTILLYGHYDVQPADDEEKLWRTPPFEPVEAEGRLYARGASDMKGQMMATFAAVESILKTGDLPVNIKWILEGEEETGSPSLAPFLRQHRDLLQADYCLNPDAGMLGPDKPTITYALRGLAYFEIRVFGPDHDLHSGIYGGVVANPANVLARLIAGMHDENGRITLPGFYDSVRELSPEERAELARLPMDEAYYLEQTGAPALDGERGYTPVERAGARPTLDVNGLLSGYTKEGAKTVLPAWAMAKISMRLVPDQDPDEVHRQLLAYLEAQAPASVRWEVTPMHGGHPSISDRNGPGVRALVRAFEAEFGVKPFFKREGGSIPVVADMQTILGIDSVLTGFGLPDDNLHAPNEKLDLGVWRRGIRTLIHFFFSA